MEIQILLKTTPMRRRRKAITALIQGVLFSDTEMEQMTILYPRSVCNEVSAAVKTTGLVKTTRVSDRELLKIAVQDNLADDGCTDPDILDNFLGWYAMVASDSG